MIPENSKKVILLLYCDKKEINTCKEEKNI